jgi:ketosteroid isomerase-like protein
MLVDEIKSVVKRFVDEPWNKGNVDIIDELCAPDYTVTELVSKWKGGRKDLKDAIIKNRATSPNFHAEVGEIIVEGNRVAYLWTMTGTNEQGKSETNVGITLLRLEKGKIVEDRFVAGTIPQEASPS